MEDKIDPLILVFNRLIISPDTAEVLFNINNELSHKNNLQITDSLLKNNPMINSLENKLNAQIIDEQLQFKMNKPKLGVGLDYAIVSKRTDMNVENNGRDVLMPMISLSLPIYRKRNSAAIQESQKMQMSLEYQIVDFENQLISSYELARYEKDKAYTQYELFEAQKERLVQLANLLYSEYSNSGKDFEELLRTQRDILKYDLNITMAVKSFYVAQAKMDFITANNP